MNWSKGNLKTGRCPVFSRPTGVTCPKTCPFRTGKAGTCYGTRTEDFRPGVLKHSLPNLSLSWEDIVSFLRYCREQGYPGRAHERGDFGKAGKVDRAYIGEWKRALRLVCPRPKPWMFTHFIRSKTIASLDDYGLTAYASIHTHRDLIAARAAGFKRFAFVLPITVTRWKQTVNKPFVPGPGGELYRLCPSQLRGHNQVQCHNCGWCWRHRRHVAFLKH